jgi:hypothetical protein
MFEDWMDSQEGLSRPRVKVKSIQLTDVFLKSKKNKT